MEWLKRLGAAVDYIEKHLDGELSYKEAARIACCSPYYFQRVFSYVTGVSLAEYVRRRRMTQAAFDLQRTDAKVIDIALKYGYSSPTAFNRAFQAVHGIPPTAARSSGNALRSYPPIRFRVEVTGEHAMTYRIVKKPSLHIVGIRTPMVDDMEENIKIVPEFWQATLHGPLFARICALPAREPKGILGISVYEDPQNIHYYIGIASDTPTPPDMYEYDIPAALWVVFENEGGYKEEVQRIFRHFYTEWLPFSGYQYAGLPDIEVYLMADTNPRHGHSEVWIAICEEDK